MRAGWWLFGFAVSFGCASVDTGEVKGKTYRRIGYVEVFVPETDERIEAVRVQSLGVSFEGGFSLGWSDEELVWIPLRASDRAGMPTQAACSVVVIVRSDAEAQHASEILTDVVGEDICMVSFQ